MKPTLPHSLNRDLAFGVVLLIVTLLAYWPALNGSQLWDDDAHITAPELRSIAGLAKIWTHPGATQQYYPVVHSVFWAACHVWGDSPLGYHLLNILLHVFSALLLVRILRFLQVPGNAAWLAGAVFALHPVQVESVAWITELKNTLSGVFFLGTILAYLKYDNKRTRNLYAGAVGLFVLGLLSKSVIATLPVVLLAVFWWKRGRIGWKQDVVPLLPFFGVGLVSGLFTAWMEHNVYGAQGEGFNFSIIERCLIAGRAVWFYLGKLFFPVDLIFIYPRWLVSQTLGWQYFFPAGALIMAVAAWTLRNRWRAPLAVFVCFTVTLFPVMGFFNVVPFKFSFVADHFQYLACIGPIALASGLVNRGCGLLKEGVRRFLEPAVYGVLLAVLVGMTWKQSGMYADAEALYRTTILKNPACWLAHNNLGIRLFYTGRTDEAIAHYRKALEINPGYALACYNMGNALSRAGRTDEAVASYRKAIAIKPDVVEFHNNFGDLLERIGRTEEAIAEYQKALEINPGRVEAYINLGLLLAKNGRSGDAIANYRKALEVDPGSSVAHFYFGYVLEKTGQIQEAIAQYQRALEINPGFSEAWNSIGNILARTDRMEGAIALYRKALEVNPDYGEAHYNLGNALLQTGRTGEAIVHYRKALSINPDKISALNNLSIAFVQTGQLTDAIPLLKKAIALAKSAGDESQAKEMAAKLEKLCQASRSFHEKQRQ